MVALREQGFGIALALVALVSLALGCSGTSSPSDSDAGSDVTGDGGYPDAAPAGFSVQFVDPVRGPFVGGTSVSIRGNGFHEECVVFVGGRMVEPLTQTFIDSRRFAIQTPPGNPGLADVEVRCDGATASLSEAFTYEAILVDPPVGSVVGGTRVTIEGFGTDFAAGTQVRFDGLALTQIDVQGDQKITGLTPPGVSGAADVEVETATALYEARRGYTYLATADPFSGGMGGGPIDGDVNIVVVDAATDNGIDNAYVSIGDPQSSPLQGYADSLGQISFSDAELAGPITTTAAAPGYETASFVHYDARDITIFLRRPPEPTPPGPLPPPPQSGRIYGHVVFGDSTGIGSPHWNLVPEPRTPTEKKRIYVATTASSIFSSSPIAKVVDYEGYDPNVTAWEFELSSRPKATAIVALAGLFDRSAGTFEPFAMGVARGILVGPGEDVIGVDVVVNIPLDNTLLIELEDPPRLNTPGWEGPIEYTMRPFIELGGEGAIIMGGHGLPPLAPPALRPGTYRFDEGSESIVLPSMAPLTGPLADASYSFIAGAYSANGGTPYSVRIERGIDEVNLPIAIGDFLGTPRAVDPAPDGVASELAVELELETPPSLRPTFFMHNFVDGEGGMLMRMFSRGDLARVPIPNLAGKAMGEEPLTLMPLGQDVSWTFYGIKLPDLSFDDFNYRQLSIQYWSAYAADAEWVQFPEAP